ncbi:quercetin 2,3-dioxygenase [Streptomyces sp. NBC_01565]|uniref:quercetin 2,3-dioxygenase n=1 Tax=unclassified Streptomyces TaxID=2593676 RepID=UPI0022586B2A|nr:quercetin 2,3-dioxygenase [Streptomyces sp. NBC_01565]MCX4539313.1 quercetin 2,3-dioxygenase [Streptomyces sp. NBC_01565]
MSPTSEEAQTAPIALGRDEGEALWFLDFLARVKGSAAQMNGASSVVEFLGRSGSGSPLHVHHHDDEWWYVLDGEMTFWVAGRPIPATTGSFVYGPRHVPHTFLVTSDEARFLHVTEPGGFDGFLRELARPAGSLEIPSGPDALPDLEHILAVAAPYGIEVLGPPGIPSATPGTGARNEGRTP